MAKKNGETKSKPETKDSAMEKRPDSMPVKGIVEGVIPGFEFLGKEDLIVPRLALVQAQSNCIDPNNEDAPKAGQFINTVTMEVYDSPVKIVPLVFRKAAILFGEELSDPMVCRSLDGILGTPNGTCLQCDDYYAAPWASDDPPACTELFETAIALFDEEVPLPLILSMSRTGAKAAKQWRTTAKYESVRNRMPLFSQVYDVKSDYVQSEKGNYFKYIVERNSKVEAKWEKFMPLYEMLVGMYTEGKVTSDMDGENADSITPNDGIPF